MPIYPEESVFQNIPYKYRYCLTQRWSSDMEKFHELLECLSSNDYQVNYAIAKSNNSCIMCGRLASGFRDAATRLEYDISALCQECQDACFGSK